MAVKNFNTEDCMSVQQIKYALEHIAHLACSIQCVCDSIIENGDKQGDLIVAAENLAATIGWTADRCLGFDVKSSDDWLIPHILNAVGVDTKTES